jgi:uncharacterized protein with ParB-like and HNH nuclease domain
MNDRISVKPDTIFLEDILDDVANGYYKIPVFQREFVWSPAQKLKLFDSLLNGYPIGSLLFWKTEESYETKDKIGPYTINKQAPEFRYVLDGFQRISTLFGILINPRNFESSNESNDFSIFFDVKENSFSTIKVRRNPNIFSVNLYKIYDNRELFAYIKELDRQNISDEDKNQYIDNARNLHDILHKYKLPFVEIKGGDIRSAIEIFSRLNSTGTEISEDYMLSARIYGDSKFKLIDSITGFLNSLNTYNFEDLKRDTVLNCISNAKGRIYFDVKIEDLLDEKLNLESFVNTSYVHIEKAVRFLYTKLFVIDIRLLPYPSQLIFISEYFRLNPEPSQTQMTDLEKWFWMTTYSNYFTIYSLSQQRSAYQAFYEFARDRSGDGIYKVNSDMVFNTAKYPDKLNFASVRSKALQLFYLRSIIAENIIQERESLKSLFIYSKKDKNPSNIILRLSSNFEESREKKQIDSFIVSSSREVLERHFITQEIVDLYKQDKIDDFIKAREENLKSKERQFVEQLEGIRYTH